MEVPHQLSIMVQLTRALVHALERGRMHADIKPDNILINDAGRVFIIDWGLSYRAGEARAGWRCAAAHCVIDLRELRIFHLRATDLRRHLHACLPQSGLGLGSQLDPSDVIRGSDGGMPR